MDPPQIFFIFFFGAADVSHCIFCAGALIVAATWLPHAGLRPESELAAPIFVFFERRCSRRRNDWRRCADVRPVSAIDSRAALSERARSSKPLKRKKEEGDRNGFREVGWMATARGGTATRQPTLVADSAAEARAPGAHAAPRALEGLGRKLPSGARVSGVRRAVAGVRGWIIDPFTRSSTARCDSRHDAGRSAARSRELVPSPPVSSASAEMDAGWRPIA